MTGESDGGQPGQGARWPVDDDDAPTQPQPVLPAPRYAEPQRIDPQQPVDGGAGRSRKPLIIVLIAVLLLGGGGAALAVPDVANRLQLPWAPNKPTAEEPLPRPIERALDGAESAGRQPTAEGVAAALAGAIADGRLGSLSGSVVDPETGAVLWERDAGKLLSPASTAKILTAAAALLTMEPDSRLTTTVVRGPEPGSVVLVAGGDPTLTSVAKDAEPPYPGAARLDDLVARVRKSAGDVEEVYLDSSAFRGENTAPGWDPQDAPSTYAAPVDAAMLDGGRRDPADAKSMREPDPSGALLAEFARRIGARPVSEPAVADPDADVLGEVQSAPLMTLVEVMLRESDNVLAEAVARQVALAEGEEPSFAGASDAIRSALSGAGFDTTGVTLFDGSGLSPRDRVPPRLLADVLAAAVDDGSHAARLRPLLNGLPVAGGSGTLADRYGDDAAAPGKGWVRAKTGTLSEVNTLAGVVLDSDGAVLVFALMSAKSDANSARPALDAVAAALRGCGCR